MAHDGPGGRTRVLWLIKGLGPGGAEQLLVNQARVRNSDSFEYSAAFLVPWKNQRVGALEDLGVRVLCLDARADADPRWVLRLRKHLVDDPVDVIHNHSPLVASATRLVTRTLPRSKRPALVYTEHNRWPRHNRFTRIANRLTYPLDDAQVAVSDDVIATIPETRRSGIETLVHGIVLDEVRASIAHRDEVRHELGIGADEVVVGIVANFRKEKDYPTLLEAARVALGNSPVPLRFVSVGQGPLDADIRARHRQLGLGDRFLILGYRQDAVRAMSAFDIFTLSSMHEGLPVSLMDALALGQPVVATHVGGIAQAVAHGSEALLVPPQRPDLLADAYIALVTDPSRRAAMSVAASERARHFDIAETTEHLERLYHKVASERPGAHTNAARRPSP